MNINLLEFLIVLGLLFWSISAWRSLSFISVGKIRKINAKNKKLADKVSKFFQYKTEYEIILRFLIFFISGVLTALTVVFYRKIFPHVPIHIISLYSATSTFFLLLVTEIISEIFVLLFDMIVMKITMPVLEAMRVSIFFPVVKLASVTGKKTKKIQNLIPYGETSGEVSAEDEILSLVEGDKKNKIRESEKKIIKGAFNLDNIQVKEIMTSRVNTIAIPVETSIIEAKKVLIASGHTRIPVFEKNIDKIIGILHARDLLNEEQITEKRVKDIVREPLVILEDEIVMELLKKFKRKGAHFAIVMDKYEGMSGIITFEDIIRQLVGEVRDEFDKNYKLSDEKMGLCRNAMIFNGKTPLSEIKEILDGLVFDDDDNLITISGYVCAKIVRIPEKGEKIRLNRALSVVILDADKRKILNIQIIKNIQE
jgi:putative hemolysin